MMTYDLKTSVSVLSVYMVSMTLFFNFSSFLLFWVLMEINMVVFIFLIYSTNKETSPELSAGSFQYLVVQTLGSVLLFMSTVSESTLGMGLSESALVLSLIMKMGLFPFQSWLFQLSKTMGPLPLSVLLTIQKIPPIIMLSSCSLSHSTTVMILSAVTGSALILLSASIKSMIVASSIYLTIWIWIILQVSLAAFIWTYFIYALFTIYALMSINGMEQGEQQMSSAMLITTAFLLGLPPASMFFFKMVGMSSVMLTLSSGVWGLIWVAVMVSMVGYLKLMIPSMMISTYRTPMKTNSSSMLRDLLMVTQTLLLLFTVL